MEKFIDNVCELISMWPTLNFILFLFGCLFANMDMKNSGCYSKWAPSDYVAPGFRVGCWFNKSVE